MSDDEFVYTEEQATKPLFVGPITDAMIERATKGIVEAHEAEMRAYLNGDVAVNAWRPEVYARAALTAALGGTQ